MSYCITSKETLPMVQIRFQSIFLLVSICQFFWLIKILRPSC